MNERCDDCGFVYDLTLDAHAGAAILLEADQLARSSSRAARVSTRRPAPATWSVLEYCCHVRDVLLVQRERVLLARRTIGLRSRRWVATSASNTTATRCKSRPRSPGSCATRRVLFAGVLARFDDEAWSRTLIYNYPEPTERDLAWVAVHTQHEAHHHLADVRSADRRLDVDNDEEDPMPRSSTSLAELFEVAHSARPGADGRRRRTAPSTIAVCNAGGLGSLPCAMLTPDAIRDELRGDPRRDDRAVQRQLLRATANPNRMRRPKHAGVTRWRRTTRSSASIRTRSRPPPDARRSITMLPMSSRSSDRPSSASTSGFRTTHSSRVCKSWGSKILASATTVDEARVARRARRRRGDRPRRRGGRPPRDVPVERPHDTDRHVRAGAAGRATRWRCRSSLRAASPTPTECGQRARWARPGCRSAPRICSAPRRRPARSTAPRCAATRRGTPL